VRHLQRYIATVALMTLLCVAVLGAGYTVDAVRHSEQSASAAPSNECILGIGAFGLGVIGGILAPDLTAAFIIGGFGLGAGAIATADSCEAVARWVDPYQLGFAFCTRYYVTSNWQWMWPGWYLETRYYRTACGTNVGFGAGGGGGGTW
jgi:hypothetical protein